MVGKKEGLYLNLIWTFKLKWSGGGMVDAKIMGGQRAIGVEPRKLRV